MAHIGHPLLGDPVYGRRPKQADLARVPNLATFQRQALHAGVLGFDHPVTATRLRFETPLPADIRALLAELESL
jgi:23S rRNA pseudouridine1911/1915/1917 synthase